MDQLVERLVLAALGALLGGGIAAVLLWFGMDGPEGIPWIIVASAAAIFGGLAALFGRPFFGALWELIKPDLTDL